MSALIRNKTNELNTYDMIWAVTQDAVNTQLQWLFTFGNIDPQIIFGDPNVEGFNISARLKPPRLAFDSVEIGHATMVVTLEEGTLTTWTGFGPAAKEVKYDCKDWRFGFDVLLNIAKLGNDLKMLPKSVEEKIRNRGFLDTKLFSVRHIFLDFQNSNFSHFDEKRTGIVLSESDKDIAPTIKNIFVTGMKGYFSRIKNTENPYILGYTATEETPQAELGKVMFAPTGVNYSSHQYKNAPGLDPNDKTHLGMSTLNFMMMTDHIDPSADPRDGVFSRNLVEEPGIDGTAVIRKELFHDRYLKPLWDKLVEAIKPTTPPVKVSRYDANVIKDEDTGNEFQFSANIVTFADIGGFKKIIYYERKNLTMELKTVADHIELVGTGLIHTGITLKQYTGTWSPWGGKGEEYLGQFWGKTTATIDFSLKFLAGADGKLLIEPFFNFGFPTLDKGHSGVLGEISNLFAELGLGPKIENSVQDSTNKLHTAIEQHFLNKIQGAFEPLTQRIILPGAKEFFYKKLQLTPEGNTQLYMSYKPEDA